jgi:cytochrome b
VSAPPGSGHAVERIWDPFVRVAHWSLVCTVATAWLTRHAAGSWHEWLGYAALAVTASRLIWGGIGPRAARFGCFVRGPRATWQYARSALRGRERRFVGHNPLGAWMIVALLATTALVCASGWLYTTDRFWGVEWVERVHRTASNLLLGLIAVHVAGVLHASFRHRENLIAAMLHGRKRPADPL